MFDKVILASFLVSFLGLAYSLLSVILIERKESKAKKSDKLSKIVYKSSARFINGNNLALILSAIILASFFSMSDIGIKAASAFLCGAILTFFLGKISLRILNALNIRISIESSRNESDLKMIDEAVGIVSIIASSLALLAAAFSCRFSGIGDMSKIILPFALGGVFALAFSRISGGIFLKSIHYSAPDVIKDIPNAIVNIFSASENFFAILLIASSSLFFLGNLISGDSRVSSAALGLILVLAAIIILNSILIRVLKNVQTDKILKVSFWVSAFIEIAAAYFIVRKVIGSSIFFWTFAIGAALALFLENFRPIMAKGTMEKGLRLFLMYAIFALSFRLSKDYGLAFAGLGAISVLAISFMKNLHLCFIENSSISFELPEKIMEAKKEEKNQMEKILFELSEICVIILFLMLFRFMLISKLPSLPLASFFAGRTLFGLFSGSLAAIWAYSLFKNSVLKIKERSEKEMLNALEENNYKRYIKIVSSLSFNGTIAALAVLVIFPIIVLAGLGLHAFLALVSGLVSTGLAIGLIEEGGGEILNAEIIEAVKLLLLLSIVILPAI